MTALACYRTTVNHGAVPWLRSRYRWRRLLPPVSAFCPEHCRCVLLTGFSLTTAPHTCGHVCSSSQPPSPEGEYEREERARRAGLEDEDGNDELLMGTGAGRGIASEARELSAAAIEELEFDRALEDV